MRTVTALSFADQILPPPPDTTLPVPLGLRYIIATQQRSGSTLLADALTETGLAGKPDEWFLTRANGDEMLKQRFGIADDAGYVDQLIRATATPNGVFGTKLFWRQWDALIPKLIAKTGLDDGRPIAETLPALLTVGLGGPAKYVWLRRRNRVAQAISLYRAQNSGVWRAVAGRGDEDSAADRETLFDLEAISAQIRRLADEDGKWGAYFHTYRITPLMLFYEDFIADYDRTVRGVLKFLGQPYKEVTIASPKLERQADERSTAWEERYRAEVTAGYGTG